MLYPLGIVTGLLIAILIYLFLLHYKPTIDRRIRQVGSKLQTKGKILDIEKPLQEWLEELPHEAHQTGE